MNYSGCEVTHLIYIGFLSQVDIKTNQNWMTVERAQEEINFKVSLMHTDNSFNDDKMHRALEVDYFR